jgi:hypothetical protein
MDTALFKSCKRAARARQLHEARHCTLGTPAAGILVSYSGLCAFAAWNVRKGTRRQRTTALLPLTVGTLAAPILFDRVTQAVRASRPLSPAAST